MKAHENRRLLKNESDIRYICAMKTWGRFLLIFFAYGIALLHTAVPHHHSQGATHDAVISHAGCLFTQSGGGLLQKVFSTDLGFGHLETFKKGNSAEIESAPGAVLLITTPAIFADALSTSLTPLSKPSLRYIENLKKRLLLFSVSHLRAPPVR